MLAPKKSCIRETLNLSTCVDSSTDTKTDKNGQKEKKKIIFFCKWHVLRVSCHLSRVTDANSNSHIPFPLLTPQLCTGGWFKKT